MPSEKPLSKDTTVKSKSEGVNVQDEIAKNKNNGKVSQASPRNILLLLKTFIGDLLRSKSLFVIYFIYTTLVVACNMLALVFPYIAKIAIDEVLPNRAARLFWSLVIFGVLFTITQLYIGIFMRYIKVNCENAILSMLRKRIFVRLLKVPMDAPRTKALGSISQRMISDTSDYTEFVFSFVPMILSNTAQFLLICTILVKAHSILFIMLAISIPGSIIVKTIVTSFYRKIYSQYQLLRDNQVDTVNLATNGFVTILAFGAIERIRKIFSTSIDREMNLRRSRWKVQSWETLGEWFFTDGLREFIVWGAWYYTLIGKVSLGETVAAIWYFQIAMGPLMTIIGSIKSIAQASVSAERIMTADTFKNTYNRKTISRYKSDARIEFKNVYFKYPTSEEYVIKDFSAEIQCGMVIGITGPSGIGKTTLGKLVAGHLVPDRGTVGFPFESYLNGQDDTDGTSILYIPEDQVLLPLPIKENILFYTEDIDMKRLEKCIQLSCLDEVLSQFPDGINSKDTMFELSKGQMQRLLLARSMYALENKRGFVLDDAISNLDTTLIRKIMNYLKQIVREKDMIGIVISHRNELLEATDAIYRFDKDRGLEYMENVNWESANYDKNECQ